MSTGEANKAPTQPLDARLTAALAAGDASTRLKAALAIGSNPEPGLVDALVARCAIEPDFYVRDMLSWVLTRLPPEITLPRLLAELRSERAQARSQSLHTLSKIKDASAFPAITRSLLRDSDDEVARSAWRAAVALVPRGQEKDLAEELAEQLGRGDRGVQLSLAEPRACRPWRRGRRPGRPKGDGERRCGRPSACDRYGATPARPGRWFRACHQRCETDIRPREK